VSAWRATSISLESEARAERPIEAWRKEQSVTPIHIFWLFIILSSLQPAFQRRILAARRVRALRKLEREHGSRAISLIHRRESLSFLGIPFGGYIDIDDSEEIVRAIEMTGKQMPLDVILHTPGGLVLAAEQIAQTLANHPGPVRVYVPHYAMSGGTLIALAADEIIMSPSAVLGPVDPQLGEYPAASILAAVHSKDPNEIDDKTLILADVSTKAQTQVRAFVGSLLRRKLPDKQADELADILSSGRWTHDFPIDLELARSLGLKVSDDLPDSVRELMRLYPQPRNRRPSVEYIPLPYDTTPSQPTPSRRSDK
jgi:ClpP class serine protease